MLHELSSEEYVLPLVERRRRAGLQEPFGDFDFQSAYDLGKPEQSTNPGPPYIVVCIDEGEDVDDNLGTQGQGVVHSAASGILYPEAAGIIRASGEITVIYSHDSCGGAQEYANTHNISAPGDVVGDEQAQRLAEESGVVYGGRLPITKRQPDLHPAKTIYYNADPKFEPSRITGLPIGFETSRWFWGQELTTRDTDLAITIAMGQRGLGEYFTADNPLHLVGVTRVGDKATIAGEITQIRNSNPHGSRIRTSLITTK